MSKLKMTLFTGLYLFMTLANAAILTENLNFSANGQNMWGTGDGLSPVLTESSTAWSASTTVGSITGSVSTVSIPASYVNVPYWVPPSGWGCRKRKWGVCVWYGYKNSGRWSSYSQQVPGTGVSYDVDSRTGTEARLSTSGYVGVKSNLGLNGGTVDAQFGYDATVLLPENVKPGEFFSLNGGASLSSGLIKTQFPKLTGSISANFGVDISASVTGCVAGAGCSSSNTTIADIDTGDMRLLDINTENLPDKMALFGLDEIAFDITRFPVNADLVVTPAGVPVVSISVPGLSISGAGVNLATVEVDYPDFRTEGALANEIVKASGTANDLLALTADLDSVALLNGAPTLLGAVVSGGSWPASFTLRGDLLDISAGPTLDVSQNFELESNLMVDLAFSRNVYADFGGGDVRQIDYWSGQFSEMPDFMLAGLDAVEVSPTYWLDSWLSNTTSMDIDVTGYVDSMKGSLSLAGLPVWDDVLLSSSLAFPVTSIEVFNDSFQVSGFDRVAGRSFVLQAVPEPSILALFLLGMAGMLFARRSGKRFPVSGNYRMAA